MKKIIEIKDINKYYSVGAEKLHALKDVTLEVDEGEFLAILGPSGSGKSTLMNVIGCMDKPDSGSYRLDDCQIEQASEKELTRIRNEKIGFIFQKYHLIQTYNVMQNIIMPLLVRGMTQKEAEAASLETIRMLELEERMHHKPRELSGGQQQRVAFARAIVIEPACILFDEPLSALDALLREEMRSELRTLITKLGITGVFVTHDQIEAMSMSDAIVVCHAGKVEQYDTPEKIYSHPATEFVARFVGSSNWLDQNHLFRPEQAQTVPTEQAEKYDADVTAVQFLGSSYQLQLNHNGQDWTYISPRRVSVGEKLSLYLPRNAIVAV